MGVSLSIFCIFAHFSAKTSKKWESKRFFGSVSDLLVIILGSIRFHEVKSLNVRLRIRSVIKNAFLQIYKRSK